MKTVCFTQWLTETTVRETLSQVESASFCLFHGLHRLCLQCLSPISTTMLYSTLLGGRQWINPIISSSHISKLDAIMNSSHFEWGNRVIKTELIQVQYSLLQYVCIGSASGFKYVFVLFFSLEHLNIHIIKCLWDRTWVSTQNSLWFTFFLYTKPGGNS